MNLYIPKNYRNILGDQEATEKAIKSVKDMFQDNLSAQLALLRVTAPMVVLSGTGINDELNGVERPVSFPIKDMQERKAEVVHSLAKWKRLKLKEMNIAPGRGIYTDMNALRPDEELDNIHSIYVDQWDWEKVIRKEDRNLAFLKRTVQRIYEAVKVTENKLFVEFPQIVPELPDEIKFIHSEELVQMYPGLSPKERENAVVEKYGAVFIIGIATTAAPPTTTTGAPPTKTATSASTATCSCGTMSSAGPSSFRAWAYAWTRPHCASSSQSRAKNTRLSCCSTGSCSPENSPTPSAAA